MRRGRSPGAALSLRGGQRRAAPVRVAHSLLDRAARVHDASSLDTWKSGGYAGGGEPRRLLTPSENPASSSRRAICPDRWYVQRRPKNVSKNARAAMTSDTSRSTWLSFKGHPLPSCNPHVQCAAMAWMTDGDDVEVVWRCRRRRRRPTQRRARSPVQARRLERPREPGCPPPRRRWPITAPRTHVATSLRRMRQGRVADWCSCDGANPRTCATARPATPRSQGMSLMRIPYVQAEVVCPLNLSGILLY
jgi:hypothetical protein